MSFFSKIISFFHKETRLETLAYQNIFTTGIYHGRSDQKIAVVDIPLARIVDIVQQRAREDGQWCIDNDLVGDDEDKMRKMMAYVSHRENIEDCVMHNFRIDPLLDIDFVCRDLANASRLSWVTS